MSRSSELYPSSCLDEAAAAGAGSAIGGFAGAGADAGASSGAAQRSVNVGILNVGLKGFGNEMVVPNFISTALTLVR